MSETLEQIALRVAAEMDNVYLRNVPAVVLQEFARRLVAALGAQEPVVIVHCDALNTYTKVRFQILADDTFTPKLSNLSVPLYTAPVVNPAAQSSALPLKSEK